MADPKRFSKEQVEYTNNHGTSPEQCSKCTHYLNPTTCDIVVGRINPDGWCNKFSSKRRAA